MCGRSAGHGRVCPVSPGPGPDGLPEYTPRGSYCSWRPEFCADDGAYSVDVPLQWSKTYEHNGDVRKRFYLGLPAPRTVMLRNTVTGTEAEVRITIATVSGHVTPGGGANPVFTISTWRVQLRSYGRHRIICKVWMDRPQSRDAGAVQLAGDTALPQPADYAMSWFGLGLLITAPSPLSLSDGIYEGALTTPQETRAATSTLVMTSRPNRSR